MHFKSTGLIVSLHYTFQNNPIDFAKIQHVPTEIHWRQWNAIDNGFGWPKCSLKFAELAKTFDPELRVKHWFYYCWRSLYMNARPILLQRGMNAKSGIDRYSKYTWNTEQSVCIMTDPQLIAHTHVLTRPYTCISLDSVWNSFAEETTRRIQNKTEHTITSLCICARQIHADLDATPSHTELDEAMEKHQQRATIQWTQSARTRLNHHKTIEEACGDNSTLNMVKTKKSRRNAANLWSRYFVVNARILELYVAFSRQLCVETKFVTKFRWFRYHLMM